MIDPASETDEPRLNAVFLHAERGTERMQSRMRDLERAAQLFGRTISSAFAASVAGGRSFDDVLKSLYMRLSDMSLRLAFRSLESALSKGFGSLFGGGSVPGNSDRHAETKWVKPFASGGVIGTPTYFPTMSGDVGLAGEAGPEAILPLARGSDGRLGVAANGGTSPRIVVNIATPDAGSFRRSEAFVTGQIARAVMRGQRGL